MGNIEDNELAVRIHENDISAISKFTLTFKHFKLSKVNR
jgi:hypothetical protein